MQARLKGRLSASRCLGVALLSGGPRGASLLARGPDTRAPGRGARGARLLLRGVLSLPLALGVPSVAPLGSLAALEAPVAAEAPAASGARSGSGPTPDAEATTGSRPTSGVGATTGTRATTDTEATTSTGAAGQGAPAAAADPAREAFARGLREADAVAAFAATHPTEREEVARRYRRAAEEFEAAWKAGAASSEVFTNAANCYAFAGDTGRAVLFYRRALAVSPAGSGAQKSLEFLRAELPIRKDSRSASSSILHSLFFWHAGVAFSARRLAFMLVFPAAFVCFAVALRRRRPFVTLGSIFLAVGLAILGSLLLDAAGGSLRDEAVVLTEVQGLLGAGPPYSASHSRPFPPGTEVTILEAQSRPASAATAGETWLRVRLLDGRESWIPEGVVERVLTPTSK